MNDDTAAISIYAHDEDAVRLASEIKVCTEVNKYPNNINNVRGNISTQLFSILAWNVSSLGGLSGELYPRSV